MYYLFTHWGISPGAYYKMPAGEKIMIRAFAEHSAEGAKN